MQRRQIAYFYNLRVAHIAERKAEQSLSFDRKSSAPISASSYSQPFARFDRKNFRWIGVNFGFLAAQKNFEKSEKKACQPLTG
jgi:hypothetical protein